MKAEAWQASRMDYKRRNTERIAALGLYRSRGTPDRTIMRLLDLRHFTWVENPVSDVNDDKTFECLDTNLVSQTFHTYQVSIARH